MLMFGDDFIRTHIKQVRNLHAYLMNKFGFKTNKKNRRHTIQEVQENERMRRD